MEDTGAGAQSPFFSAASGHPGMGDRRQNLGCLDDGGLRSWRWTSAFRRRVAQLAARICPASSPAAAAQWLRIAPSAVARASATSSTSTAAASEEMCAQRLDDRLRLKERATPRSTQRQRVRSRAPQPACACHGLPARRTARVFSFGAQNALFWLAAALLHGCGRPPPRARRLSLLSIL